MYESYGLPGAANVVRFVVYAAVLMALAHCCERSYRRRDRLLRLLDHTLINKELDTSKLSRAYHQFSIVFIIIIVMAW